MKSLLTIAALITLCSFGNEGKHTIQRRQGILIETQKGFKFTPLEDWRDYTPKVGGDTLYQYKTT